MFCPVCGLRYVEVKNWQGEVVNKYCKRKCVIKEKRQKIGDYSGRSKSENAFNDYK